MRGGWKCNFQFPSNTWTYHSVAWRGRAVWRHPEALAVYCSFLGTDRRKQANRLSATHLTRSGLRRCNGWDSRLHKPGAMAYAYLFKYIIIGDTGKPPARPSVSTGLAVSRELAPYFRSVGRSNDVVKAGTRGWRDSSNSFLLSHLVKV